MHPTILRSVVDKIEGKNGPFNLGMSNGLGEGNSEIKPVKLCLTLCDCSSEMGW